MSTHDTAADLSSIFDAIYLQDSWTHGSGPGSIYADCQPYINLLESFIRDNSVNSVLDLGCGDWQFSSKINFGGIDYIGVDVSQRLINRNTKLYGSATNKFLLLDSYETLPVADLLLCKDVLQHLSLASVSNIINRCFPKYPFVLVTNCIPPYRKIFALAYQYIKKSTLYNKSISSGEFTYFDPSLPPYNLEATRLLVWNSTERLPKEACAELSSLKRFIIGHKYLWRKSCYLIDNRK